MAVITLVAFVNIVCPHLIQDVQQSLPAASSLLVPSALPVYSGLPSAGDTERQVLGLFFVWS